MSLFYMFLRVGVKSNFAKYGDFVKISCVYLLVVIVGGNHFIRILFTIGRFPVNGDVVKRMDRVKAI